MQSLPGSTRFQIFNQGGEDDLSTCQFCDQQIFWHNINGKMKPFEDQNGTVYHNCPKLKNQPVKLEDDHVLLAHTIIRLSKLERTVSELKERLDDKNEV